MRFVKPIIYGSFVTLALAGCGTNNDNEFAYDSSPPTQNINYDDTQNTSDWTDYNQNDNYTGNDRYNTRYPMNVNNNKQNYDRIDVADDIADAVAQLDEVDNAYVLMTRNNAYVAVKLTDQSRGQLSEDVEKKIANKARDVDNNLDNVYVSENPDFYERMHGYRNDLNNGEPVSGFFEEFSSIIRRIFPTAR